MSILTLRTLHRPSAKNVGLFGGSQTERFSFDFVIDGVSLYEQLAAQSRDLISILGWSPPDYERQCVDQLLLRADAPAAGNRRMLFVCPECGDLGCGAITCVIEQHGPFIVWRDFGFENNYDEAMSDFESFADVGPFQFDSEPYRAVLESVVGVGPGWKGT